MPAAPPAPLPLRDRPMLLGGLVLISLAMVLAGRGGKFASGLDFALSWGVSIAYTLVLGWGNRQLWVWLQRRLPQVAQTRTRLWWLGLGSTAYTTGATAVLALATPLVVPGAPRIGGLLLLGVATINLVPTLVGQLLYEARHTFRQWEVNVHRADQLAQAQTQAQLDALAQQLDPHFLFNSLNTLAALIEPANAAAQHYVEGLADLYRYVLLSRERPTVPLADELALVRTYVALQQVRFRDKVQVRYDIAPTALARRVAPLSVQALLENALKHNEASAARPLHIQVCATAEALRVENAYQPRPAGLAPGLGTGLANVRQRYALLGAPTPVLVEQAARIFAVTLPLLPST